MYLVIKKKNLIIFIYIFLELPNVTDTEQSYMQRTKEMGINLIVYKIAPKYFSDFKNIILRMIQNEYYKIFIVKPTVLIPRRV